VDKPKPVTLDDLTREEKLLWVYCNDCGRERDICPTSLLLPGSMPVPSVVKRLKCSQCGGRNVTAAPELHPGGVTQYRERFR
jgi:ferredoxin